MNRTLYFNYIDEKLHVLARRIESRGKLNLLDIHLHSENFYLNFFNLLYGYELENLNTKLQNVEAIDLIDYTNRIFIQISASCTKQKVESSLNKQILENYQDYSFKFISISKDASKLRSKSFNNPFSVPFTPTTDIYDIVSILNDILIKKPIEQKEIYRFIKAELGNDIDIVKLDSNLATVINILSQENWDDKIQDESVNSFEIERKIIFNELQNSKAIIDEYCIYYKKVDEKYAEFDIQGKNKSYSVLRSIRREYLTLKHLNDSEQIFDTVIENVKDKVLASSNFIEIPIDELELCVDILVVDAFIRCKIFENPEKYNYVTS
nr:ABC-three component system protein [uncultured Draconibacterium sp.]